MHISVRVLGIGTADTGRLAGRIRTRAVRRLSDGHGGGGPASPPLAVTQPGVAAIPPLAGDGGAGTVPSANSSLKG